MSCYNFYIMLKHINISKDLMIDALQYIIRGRIIKCLHEISLIY